MKKAAVFNDLSGFGKCSLTAAIPVLSAQGVQCCPMASAVLTNQTGYEYHKCTDLTAMIKDYIDNWQKNNAHFDGQSYQRCVHISISHCRVAAMRH